MAKHVEAGKVRDWRHTVFTVQKGAGSSEQQVVVHFGHPVRYRVVKLRVRDLPRKFKDGKPITWVNNFAVVDAQGRSVERVRYTVFVHKPARKGLTFVYKDRRGLHAHRQPKYRGKMPPRHNMLQVEFETGDPGQGWKVT